MFAWDQFLLSIAVLAVISPGLGSQLFETSEIPAVTMTREDVQVPTFTSVELRNGGRVTMRQGANQRVSIVNGDSNCVRITVERGDKLLIDHQSQCADDSRLEVEVVVTSLSAAAVSNGGLLLSSGAFAPQRELAAAVNEGGILDIRAMTVQNVT